jgi:hypothetical protein
MCCILTFFQLLWRVQFPHLQTFCGSNPLILLQLVLTSPAVSPYCPPPPLLPPHPSSPGLHIQPTLALPPDNILEDSGDNDHMMTDHNCDRDCSDHNNGHMTTTMAVSTTVVATVVTRKDIGHGNNDGNKAVGQRLR